MMSQYQNSVVDYCLCGAPVYYNEDDGHPRCPDCICNVDEYEISRPRNESGFVRMYPSADAVFVKGVKVGR